MFTSVPSQPNQKLGSYSVHAGVTVTVEKGDAYDHANRVATHLASVLQMLASHDVSDEVKDSIFHANSMALEVVALLPLVVQDACLKTTK